MRRAHVVACRRTRGSLLRARERRGAQERCSPTLPAGVPLLLARPRLEPARARRRHPRRRDRDERACREDLERLDGSRVRAGAEACRARCCARQCVRWQLGPAAFFAGIPGTVGGALAMNAGAFGGETWTHVESVVDDRPRAASCTTASAAEFTVGYRSVRGPRGEWFLGATLRARARRRDDGGGDQGAARQAATRRSRCGCRAAARRSAIRPATSPGRLIEARGP